MHVHVRNSASVLCLKWCVRTLRSDMRELLEEAGASLAGELAAEHFAAHERAVLYQSARMRVLQSREGSGPGATYTRCAVCLLDD